jgi:hypothetical protein
VWRDGALPASSVTRTRHVSTAVARWATAEPLATGYGAGRDRMTSLLSRSSVWWVSRWQRWIRAWGSDEPVTNDPAACAGGCPVKCGLDIPAVHDVCAHAARPRGSRYIVGLATSRTERLGWLCLFHMALSLSKCAARGSPASRTSPWPRRRSCPRWSTVARSRDLHWTDAAGSLDGVRPH